MVKKALKAFDAAVNVTYKGFKKLIWITVIVAITAATFATLVVLGIVAALH